MRKESIVSFVFGTYLLSSVFGTPVADAHYPFEIKGDKITTCEAVTGDMNGKICFTRNSSGKGGYLVNLYNNAGEWVSGVGGGSSSKTSLDELRLSGYRVIEKYLREKAGSAKQDSDINHPAPGQP